MSVRETRATAGLRTSIVAGVLIGAAGTAGARVYRWSGAAVVGPGEIAPDLWLVVPSVLRAWNLWPI